MEKISYGGTFFFKIVFPAFWFGLLTVVLISGLVQGVQRQPVLVVQPLVMMALGYFLFRKRVWDLADEVRDGGSYLLVRKGSTEQRVQLADVMNVSMSRATSPQRLTLRLRTPGEVGDEIAFVPRMQAFQFNPFARNPIAENLIRRFDAARSERRP